MNRFFSLTLVFLLSCYSLICPTATAQSEAGIIAKRISPIGHVTFGAPVNSGVLGEGHFVDGYVRKLGDDPFIFPVGENGMLRPFAAAASETSGAYFQSDPGTEAENAVSPAGGPFKTSSLANEIGVVSNKEYWDINGEQNTKITLTWNEDSEIAKLLEIKTLSKLTIVGWSGGKWVKIPSSADELSITGERSALSAGSITTNALITPNDYQVYTLGAVSEGALPVVLVAFDVKAVETSAYLEWATTLEVNSSHFEIERSAKGKAWNAIGQVVSGSDKSSSASPGNRYSFTDSLPLPGENLYRLKMVDSDLSFAYSGIKNLHFEQNSSIVPFPNPASDLIRFKGIPANSKVSASLFDLSGRAILTTHDISDGINVSDLPGGFYLLKWTGKTGLATSQKVLIKK